MLRTSLVSAAQRWCGLLAVLVAVSCLTGCSLMVMAGKFLIGDPTVESAFKERTGVDLCKEDKELLVVCRTPFLVGKQFATLEQDLTTGILRRLKQNDVKVVSPDKVQKWMDDNGGDVGKPTELAKEFKCDFISIVEVSSIQFFEEHSKDLMRGRANGTIRTFEVQKNADGKPELALQVYTGEFTTHYPEFTSVSIHSMTVPTFQKQFLDHLALQLARHFFDHRVSETVH